jgi:hypothetical protein
MELITQQVFALSSPIKSDDFSVSVPAGWAVDIIVFKNLGALDAELNGGITVGGTEFFMTTPINGNGTNGGYTTIGGNFVPDISNPYIVYIHGTWNGMNILPYILLKKVF